MLCTQGRAAQNTSGSPTTLLTAAGRRLRLWQRKRERWVLINSRLGEPMKRGAETKWTMERERERERERK